MITQAQTLYRFFSGFGIPAYNENTVPKDAELPYLTYSLAEPEWRSKQSFHVLVYYRNASSNLASLSKADEIVQAIGEGIRLPFTGGLLAIWPETPLVQPMPPNGDVRAAYINLSINSYHMPGI